ncbi:MAG TPA: bifunctional UDP-N-acetylglucosamine diphosphorylase/glucosamine-1-phosphate N-acetyltransferase GlmU [Thermoanaerobaculia bacterium]|nr:bifunctional UDP-N-acetylglucosamine diphosphorylase/glucosamine-1-phosphate N-acetyltransferase GlmU [Thermoanaerobaculia bacterium]
MRGSKTKNPSRKRRPTVRETEPAPRVVVLAAGAGSRMRSALPKVLHRIGGRTLLDAVLDTAEEIAPSRIVAVIGAGRERVEAALGGRAVTIVVQDPPRGTGDAARRALTALSNGSGPVVILSGDAPLLTSVTLAKLIEARRANDLDLVLLTFRPPDAGDLGRVVRDAKGRVRRIVEARNATAREKRLAEANAGVYCFAARALSRALEKLSRNPVNGEYYLTDVVEILTSSGGSVEAVEAEDWREGWGINTRAELVAAEEIERRRSLERALEAGATIIDPATTRIGPKVRLEPDAIVHPFVCLEGMTVVEQGSEVLPFTRVVDSVLGVGAVVGPHCELEGARVGPRARVGPFARLRPGTVLEEDVRVGNFVETKKAILRAGAKASHLTYLGDAEIGAGANIGAGVITCNFDGERKHHTSIGEGAFIGSDSQLVAPVTVGKGAWVGAGSTITRDVPDGALAITRTPQKNVEGWVARRRARKAGA